MRHYDIPYVQNGPVNYYPAIPLQDMSLEEIKKKYIKCCAKANGDVSVCSKCKTPCQEGKRAVQLVANNVYNDPPIPLYGGKTLIERAREENMKRLEEAAKKEQEVKKAEKEEKKAYIKRGEWWEESLASGDQINWLVENMGLTKTKAKKKIYQYKWAHGMTGPTVKTDDSEEEQKENPSPVVAQRTESKDSAIESKLESLMKLQEEHKKAMAEYLKLYENAKLEYEKIKQKTDILCSALDIMNDP